MYILYAYAESDSKKCVMWLTRKTIQEGFWNDENRLEIIDSKMDFTFLEPGERERCMIEVERTCSQSIYKHKCNKGCKERGKSIYKFYL